MIKTRKIFFFFNLCLILFSCINYPKKEPVKKLHFLSVIIDPGHGGNEYGALVEYKTEDGLFIIKEKDLNLRIAKKMAARIKAKLPQADIVLTRIDDVYLSLEERVFAVNQADSNTYNTIFISIHNNYSNNTEAFGFEVYRHIPALLDPDAYITVEFIKHISGNTPLAESIVNAVGSYKGLEDLPCSIKGADYYVLRNTKVATVLIECGFLSNEREALLLVEDSYQEKLTEAIALGIENYLKANND
jgi:N-acetylmuramoyl-L-alanine amidase